MKNLSILGSTGSIGTNAMDIVKMFPESFCVKALAAKNNIILLCDQIKEVKPDIAVVYDEKSADKLRSLIPSYIKVEIMTGQKGYIAAASHSSVDIVISAMVGGAGLIPTISAIDSGKDIALANKETLVMAGEIIMKKAAEKGVKILPIDSEHSAIFQSLSGQRREDLSKILLTASGGPFREFPYNKFHLIKPVDALNHPTWNMGKKISIDSATLMNKGLEVIEAKWLFSVSEDKIDVLIHPQSIVHSMVEFIDGSIIAQLSSPDMKGAISYAISYPKRLPIKENRLDFTKITGLSFEEPNFEKFPCLKLAYNASLEGGAMPAVLNAANEIAVSAFLENKISFIKIPEIIEKAMDKHINYASPNMGDILEADMIAREYAIFLTN